MVSRPERWRADELRAVEAVSQVVEGEEQVLGTRLGECRQAFVAGPLDLLERLLCRQVDDVDGHVGGLGEADDPVGRLALEDRVTGEPVTDRVGRAGLERVGGDDVDREPVLGVHHDQPAVLLRLLHRRKIAPSSLKKTPG